MTLHNVAVAAKDGAGGAIAGGIRQNDVSGTGAGPNLPELIVVDSTGAEILGTTADAKSAATDTTPISWMQVIKQISFSIQALVTAFGAAWTRGAGATDANTQRFTLASDSPGVSSIAKTSNPAAVADGAAVVPLFDKLGKQVFVGALRDLKAEQVTTIAASTTETTIVAAGGAGVFNDLYFLLLENTSATATEVIIRDVTSTGKQRGIMVPAGETRGFALSVDSALPQLTANSAWTAQCTTSVSSIKVTAGFVKNL